MFENNSENRWIEPKIYIIFGFLALTLLFYCIDQIRPVIVDIEDFGIISHLTFVYWIGFIILLIFSIILYLDNEKDDYIYILYLIIIGLFLFGLPIFAEDNAWFAWSYYPSGEVNTILENGKIDKISEAELGTYRSWPGCHIISAYMIYFTGSKIDSVIKYMPLFWLLSVVSTTYIAGKLLGTSKNKSFMMSYFVISSFWTFNYYYGPQSIAYILYLLFIASMYLAYRVNNEKSNIFIILVFVSAVVTHMLTSIALIFSFSISLAYSKFRPLYKYRIRLITLFLVIFTGWYMYVATSMWGVGIREFAHQISNGIFFEVFATEKYNSGSILIRQITHLSKMLYLIIYVIFIVIAFYFNNREHYSFVRIRKLFLPEWSFRLPISTKYKEYKGFITLSFSWLVGILLLLVFSYGAEIDDRVYILSLFPMAYILISTFDRKIITILAILFMVLHIPAHYGTESHIMVYTSDLQGSKFIASKITEEDSINYYFTPLIRYYNSQFSNSAGFNSGYYDPDDQSMSDSTYIISSKQLSNYLIYVFSVDNIKTWLDKNVDKVSLLYDNGNYKIYKNNIYYG